MEGKLKDNSVLVREMLKLAGSWSEQGQRSGGGTAASNAEIFPRFREHTPVVYIHTGC